MSPAAIIVSFAINIAAAWLWLGWLKRQDVYAIKKRQLKAVPLFAGFGLLAAPLSLIFYRTNLWESLVEDAPSYYLFVNAPSEELGKFVIFYLVARATHSVKDPFDAAIQGASVGLGFAVAENFTYAFDVDPSTMLLRAIVCVSGHKAYAAISAFSWGAAEYYLKSKKRKNAWGFTVLGLCVATLAHALYNSAGEVALTLRFWVNLVCFAGLTALLSDSVRLSPYYNFPLYRWEEALEWLDWAIDRDGGNWILRQRRGMYLLRGGFVDEAREDFQAAALLSGNPFPKAWSAAALRLKGKGAAAGLAAAIAELQPEQREPFLRAFKRVARYSKEGPLVSREISGFVLRQQPRRRRLEAPGWDSLPGRLLRGSAAASRLKSRRTATQASRVAAAPELLTRKEKAFAYLMRKRQESRLEPGS
jgi:RsiW-degrading membrane proteinase PrsW (M82 family)